MQKQLGNECKVNEALIKEIFEPFGNMTDCFIKTNNTSVSGLRQHGYAFVHFDNSQEGKKSALAASSISRDTPYLYQGVLFHAEVMFICLDMYTYIYIYVHINKHKSKLIKKHLCIHVFIHNHIHT
jgi:hypothetical protein